MINLKLNIISYLSNYTFSENVIKCNLYNSVSTILEVWQNTQNDNKESAYTFVPNYELTIKASNTI